MMDSFARSKGPESVHDHDEKSLRHMSTTQAEAELGQATVPVAPEAGLSMGNVFKGNAAHSLTTFEKKAALINAELDKFGMGRYQWCIWFLCGFGYFLDLAWSQGVGLVASAIYQEMGVPDARQGDIYSCANAGLAIGAFTFGILVDVIGRRWAFNLTCLITSVFGLLLVCLIFCLHSIQITAETHNRTGCPKEQLWRNLRHLLPCFSRSRRKHSHRCHYRS